ncbi:predicted protein [Postia placenta Mad-698-R]|nr:predicted protein [Postia placenta Mad-698-R]
MGSLQRPPYEDRERLRDRDDPRDRERDRGERDRDHMGPRAHPSQMSLHSGSAHLLAGAAGVAVGPGMNARPPPPPSQAQMLSGPGTGPMGIPPSYGMKERERDRERERAQERAAAIGESSGARRERERHNFNEKERAREREWIREREMDGLRLDGPGMADIESERERERYHQQARAQHAQHSMHEQPPPDQWSRFTPSRSSGSVPGVIMGPDAQERERRLMEMERMERERERGERERRDREMWEAEQRALSKEKALRDKERERDERRMMKAAMTREEQMDERERERVMREREAMWLKEQERERHERAQRERMDIDAARGHPAAQPHEHHHHHLVHRHHQSPSASSQGHAHPSSKAGKQPANTSHGQPGMGPGMPQGDVHPAFELMHERQQQAGYPRLNGGQGPPMAHVVVPPPRQQQGHLQHSLPSGHLHQHTHPHAHTPGSAPPPGYAHNRQAEPLFPPNMRPSTSVSVPQRSPTPFYTYSQPPVHLGTFIWPHSPFPYLDFPGATPEASPSELTREIHATILIPSGFLLARRPARPRIWGGAAIPALPPVPPAHPHPYGQQTRPHRMEIRGVRRVYTDDSDLFLCAVHAGLITWSEARRAKSDGRDLRLEVRITKEVRFIGGLGSHSLKLPSHSGPGGAMMVDGDPEDDGRTLLSAGWGNSHDGAGVEILAAELVKVSIQ